MPQGVGTACVLQQRERGPRNKAKLDLKEMSDTRDGDMEISAGGMLRKQEELGSKAVWAKQWVQDYLRLQCKTPVSNQTKPSRAKH